MKEIILLVGAYILGNMLTGYVLAKIFYHQEIHKEGSGNAGARNAGRLFGKRAFVITFFGDATKGAIVVLLTKWFGYSLEWQLYFLLAVIIGHLFPVLLRFRGGKGMSTYIGGMLAFQPIVFSVFAGVFIIFYLIFKSVTIAGMIAVCLFPIIMLLFSYGWPVIIIAGLVSATVIFAHRHNIIEKIYGERNIS